MIVNLVKKKAELDALIRLFFDPFTMLTDNADPQSAVKSYFAISLLFVYTIFVIKKIF